MNAAPEVEMAGRIKGQGSKWIRPEKRQAIYLRDGLACVYCGRSDLLLTLDHVTPCELGGTNEAGNLVTACVSCNSAKQDLTLRQWLGVLRDRGVETAGLAAKIRRHTARNLARFRVQVAELAELAA